MDADGAMCAAASQAAVDWRLFLFICLSRFFHFFFLSAGGGGRGEGDKGVEKALCIKFPLLHSAGPRAAAAAGMLTYADVCGRMLT